MAAGHCRDETQSAKEGSVLWARGNEEKLLNESAASITLNTLKLERRFLGEAAILRRIKLLDTFVARQDLKNGNRGGQ